MKTVDLDVRAYRGEGRKLPKNFSFRFRPQTEHMMIYGRNVDLCTLDQLGAINRIERQTWIDDDINGLTIQSQYAVQFLLPDEMPLVLGKVSILPSNRSNLVIYK